MLSSGWGSSHPGERREEKEVGGWEGDLSDFSSPYSPHCALSDPRKNLIGFQTPQLLQPQDICICCSLCWKCLSPHCHPDSTFSFLSLQKAFPWFSGSFWLPRLHSALTSLLPSKVPSPSLPCAHHLVSLPQQPRRSKNPGGFLWVPSCLQGPVKARAGQVSGYTELAEMAMPRDPCCPLTRALV